MQDALFPGTETPEQQHPSARDLLAAWIDCVKTVSGYPPPKQTVGRMAKQIKDLLETHPVQLLRDALEAAAQQGTAPAGMPDLVLRIQSGREQSYVREWVRENGWPTGSRFKRGEQGGTYVRDPLGYDRPPYHVPWSPPTRSELLSALEALRVSG